MGEILLNSITHEELQNQFSQEIKKHFNDLKGHLQLQKPTDYLTRQQVADMLSVDLSTVHNWTNQGKLIPYGIGRRVYFKRSEIDNALIRF